ncbi:CDP-glycerol glycerophosphotransferase family protein [Sediminibacillus albus]|uniref:CDP-glycerol glycerophosphotransferase family protein n=1 Tax=Sediminibacillus albus TaxID=407036 RepID=UPI001FDEC1CB|nr:CDP-glycerol glycerophosphotransferase family protein [Sediminibacillus albus]
MKRSGQEQLIVLRAEGCKRDFTVDQQTAVKDFRPVRLLQFLQSIYHLATSKVIFVDNYFGFLSAADFKTETTCIQLWHAAGAIKQFGLMDPSIEKRSERAKRRFTEVYSRFHYVVVGSEKMAAIFRKSFGLNNDHILRTGIPRTDFFFDKRKTKQIENDLTERFPVIQNKKVLLYAPTFRDDQLNSPDIALDIAEMYKRLGDEYVLFLRLHPAVRSNLQNSYPEFVVDVTDYENINHLLLISDCLITDYSSIPFEYALLEKPMIFFSYDLQEYQESRGFWEDYQNNIPGPVVNNTGEIIDVLIENRFDIGKVRSFSAQWNQYSRGNSSENLVKYIYESQEQQQQILH